MPIGIDIVQINRMQSMADKKYPDKVFTSEERNYILTKHNPLRTAAGIYAAKEAVVKALGRGISLPLNEINIIHLPNGSPYAVLGKTVSGAVSDAGGRAFEISISHDGDYAVACAYMDIDPIYASYILAKNKIPPGMTDAILPAHIPKRKDNSHKGTYGRVYVLAGSMGLTGAAMLASKAILKAGAGLITLGCCKELNNIFEVALTEVMTKPLDSKDGILTSKDTDAIIREVENSDIALIGPGLGRNYDITQIMRQILAKENCPCVIDADGLYAISRDIDMLTYHKSPLILTPHIGEFSYLTGMDAETILSNTKKYAMEFARRYNVILVLKSHRTVVATPDGDVRVNYLGNPGMATGGTGDVLAGVITSFAAQAKDLSHAASLGVYLHSLAADMAANKTGEYSLTPSDILEYLPLAIKYSLTNP